MPAAKSSASKIALVVVLLAVAAGVWLFNAGEREARNEYNTVVEELYNQGQYQQTYERLIALIDNDTAGSIEDEVRQTAARAALKVAEQPDANLDHSRTWLQRAHDLDPALLSAMQRQLINADE
ncbi:hypothetical protein [Mucisphaera calidilacus]|uniref:Uncharacterized protein n=1 Tax=Mucisphaera calidilacus TaxID=2527982 RepID=A0A518C042_9BACT|nr:hypothetical protein [Mucisphaera calidilacus]QDU72592.1 hypothetical protein Pan265_24620 [Mucisphaera calidilacus]